MKAIVLTYDRNAVLADHMIACYNRLWPDHPFTFRIPYQQENRPTPGDGKEFIPSPSPIRDTVFTLLADLPDDEWVYWCIDDKYPVRLDTEPVRRLSRAIETGEADDCSGILFCRARRMLDPACLTGAETAVGNQALLERRSWHQIWLHQFIRAGVLRYLFSAFPHEMESPGVMDLLKDSLEKPDRFRLFVTAENRAVFGESTFNGVITENCLESLAETGFEVPAWQGAEPAPRSLAGHL